jgi:hypothetical protein
MWTRKGQAVYTNLEQLWTQFLQGWSHHRSEQELEEEPGALQKEFSAGTLGTGMHYKLKHTCTII